MFCPKCGTEVNPGDRFCRGCGSPIALEGEASQAQPDDQQTTAQPGADPFGSGNANRQYGNPYGQQGGYNPQGFNYNQYQDRHGENEDASKGWIALGFFFPVIGLILYLVWYDEHRRRAKYAGKGALISVCVSVASGIIIPIIMVIVAAAIGIGAAAADPYAMFARGDAALTGGAVCSVPSAKAKWAQTTPFAEIAARRSPLSSQRKIGRTGSTTRSTASFRAATAVRPNTPRPTSLSSKKKNPRAGGARWASLRPPSGLCCTLSGTKSSPSAPKK